MRIFSYRNKRRAKLTLGILAAVLLLLFLLCLFRFIYLQRFLVYTPDGVQLDYTQNLQSDRTPAEELDPAAFPVEILAAEDGMAVSSQAMEELRQLSGFYVTTSMLQDVSAVREALDAQEHISALMLDMKSIFGNFYYASTIPGAVQSSADIPAIASLLETLTAQENLYLIARIPAFSDNNFALANQAYGLPLSSGALWMDSNGCYWLDPMEEEVQSYLVSIAMELSNLGFDEVVFEDFRVPDSSSIVYNREVSRDEAAAEAAKAICAALSSYPIRVSFGSAAALVAESADRIYLQASDGSAAAGLVAGYEDSLEDTSTQVVFLTASRDTRFESYGILRPLIEDDAA